MPSQVLGKVSVTPKGDYNSGTTYYALDIVGYEGGSYLAMKEVTGVEPSNDQVNWMQLSGPGLPGEQGPQGEPGAAAGFGEATATVDDTSGTPSVEVETSGPDTAKVFTFKFYGLKGTKGDTGDKGKTGDTGPVGPQGVSVVTAQIQEDGHLVLTMSEGEPIDAGDATGPVGPQGIQGEAGESVDSIQRTSGTGAPGTTDTYTMYSTDGSTIGTFTVYNGTNGTGAGDFMADGSVPMTGNLDMNGNRVTEVGTPTADTDAANKAYVDEALEGVTITTDATPTEDSTNPVQSGGVFDALSNKQDTLSGTEDQLVGFNSAGEATAVSKPTAADVGAMPAVTGGTTGQVLTKTEAGQEWQDPPDGLPEGGTEGQVLTKTPTGAQWDDVPSDLPEGGTDGQILTKTADGVAWEDAPAVGVTSFKGRTGAVTPQSGDYTAEMVGARPSTWTPSAADVGAVPTSRTVNNKALSADISLTASDVGARPSSWTPTASEVGAVPTSRTVNGKPLSSNISLTADDVGAANPPALRTATLSASRWSGNSQTVTVQGVETSGQSVRISPATKTDADNWVAAGVWCNSPTTANQLVFTCDTAPTENININVELQEVQS